MSTLESIIKWAQKELYDWQREAVRRLLIQGELNQNDKAEILLMLKEHHGLVDPENPAPKPKPLSEADVSGAPQVPMKLTLKALSNLHNVNAIPDGEHLKFGHEGLTVIYGENGSGKSGYARILKRACRARDTMERLLPNVFVGGTSGSARASLKISVDDAQDDEVPWEDGCEGSDVLSNICVFDSRCARIIVDENNEPIYLPYGADVFEGLVALVKELRAQLEYGNPKPVKPGYSDISSATKAGQFMSQLSHDTAAYSIEEQTKWVADDELRLTNLQKDIATSEARDPKKQVQRIHNLRADLDRILDQIVCIEAALSESNAESLRAAITSLNLAESALAMASRESLAQEPLAGAGSSVWQLLYNAAREYSMQAAYPGRDFPVVDEGALCVLCMQPLQEDAKKRMARFKAFVEGTIKKKVDIALENLYQKQKQLQATYFPPVDTYQGVLGEIRSRDEALADQIQDYFPAMQGRLNQMLQSIAKREPSIVPSTPTKLIAIECLTKISQYLEDEAQAVEEAAKPEELAKKKAERDELDARKRLAARKQEIVTYSENLKIGRKYDACIQDTEFRHITEKAKSIISGALTPKLRDALAGELQALGADYLPLNLKPSGVEGETRHQFELMGCKLSGGTNLTDILSEGEQHVVAIAGFLAELGVREHKYPIVLDDPVCSLDHIYRERIAERLVKEAAKRQVVVFTHDIAFLMELKSKAGETKIYFYPQTILRHANTPGVCLDDVPWQVMSAKERLDYLSNELQKFRSLYYTDRLEYNPKASHLYALLRETWEAAVEQVLLYKTVMRHGNAVQTQQLRSVEVEDEDYDAICYGMAKCSTWMTGHDKPRALDVNLPEPNSINDDIQLLREFCKKIYKRCDETSKRRRLRLEPKMPKAG